MKIIIRWLLSVLALILVQYLFKGISFESFGTVMIAALVLGIVNAIIRPIVLILTLPINIITLGLFTLIINALMFWIVYKIVPGVEMTNFSAAFWGALIYTFINWFLNLFIIEDKKN